MPVDGAEIIKRYDQLKSKRMNFDSRWETMAKFICPTRYGIQQPQTVQGQSVQREVYDSTAIFANDILANFLSGKIINPTDKWLGFKAGRADLNDLDEIKEWMEETRDRQLSEYARSNFYVEGPEGIKDLTGFGTTSVYGGERMMGETPEYGYRGSRFETYRIGRYVIARDANGDVDTEMCEIRLTALAARRRWPKAVMPESLQQCLRPAGNPDQEFSFIYSVQPRSWQDRNKQYGNKSMPWAACYVERATKMVMEESGFRQFPFSVATWGRVPGEDYGRGPGELALNDIQTLNLAKRLGFEDWGLKIRPPVVMRSKSAVGTLRIQPGGAMIVDTKGLPIRDVIMPWQTGSSPEISQIKEEELRQSIKQIFFVAQVLQMLEVEKTQMTAYEFREKLNLLFGLLGPVYSSLETGFLRHRVETDFIRLYEEGVFSPPPDVLLEEGNNQIDIEFNNALSRAQKMGELDSMDLALLRLQPLIKTEVELYGFSEVMDWINRDKWSKRIFDIAGVPATVINSDQEVKGMREARTQSMMQKKQEEQAMMMAEGAGKAAPALKLLQGGQQVAA